MRRYRQYAKLLACCVATIILDMLINFIVFCLKKDDFQAWCHNAAINNLYLHVQNNTALLDQSITEPDITFNCWKLFTVEAEFSFACLVLMVMVYVYWAKFIIRVSRNFVLMRPEINIVRPQIPQQQRLRSTNTTTIVPLSVGGGGAVPIPIVSQSSSDPELQELSNIAPSSSKHQGSIVLA